MKIGTACNVERRLKNMQTGSPDILGLWGVIKFQDKSEAKHKEKELHKKFSTHRVKGEWFKPVKEIMTFIDTEITHWSEI